MIENHEIPDRITGKEVDQALRKALRRELGLKFKIDSHVLYEKLLNTYEEELLELMFPDDAVVQFKEQT
jgi:hypothetical protein